jgi:hypothetical protein
VKVVLFNPYYPETTTARNEGQLLTKWDFMHSLIVAGNILLVLCILSGQFIG